MPLEPGKSKAAFSHNVAAEMNAGKEQKQAVAIAYSKARGDSGTFDPSATPVSGGYSLVKGDAKPTLESVNRELEDMADHLRMLEGRLRGSDPDVIKEAREAIKDVTEEIRRLERVRAGLRDKKADEIIGRCDAGDAKIVHNKLLGGWYVVRGPHQTPLSGKFPSKEAAQQWLIDRKNARDDGESYWSYKSGSETPSLQEAIKAGAIAATTTEKEWSQLSPGMRREIARSAKKRGDEILKDDADGAPQRRMFPGYTTAELEAALSKYAKGDPHREKMETEISKRKSGESKPFSTPQAKWK